MVFDLFTSTLRRANWRRMEAIIEEKKMSHLDFDERVQSLFGSLQKLKKSRKGYVACCPAHDDSNPSLSISPSEDGKILVKCHKGCSTESVVQAAGCTMQDLMPQDGPPCRTRSQKACLKPATSGRRCTEPRGEIDRVYSYVDDDGVERYQKVRYRPKGFRIRRQGPDGKWIWNRDGQPDLIYRQPEVKQTAADSPICVAGGEKDADNLCDLGFVATCNIDGEANWKESHAAQIPSDREIVVFLDHDETGEKFGWDVARSLFHKARSIKLVRFTELAEHGDVSDWIEQGHTREELDKRIAESPCWDPHSEPWPEIAERLLPKFPTASLPEPLREFVEAESVATQTPPDLAGMLVIATCAAAGAGYVRVQAREGYVEPINLFAAVVLDPGNRKSAVFRDATAPLEEIEATEKGSMKEAVARDKEEKKQLEAKLERLRKLCVKDAPESRDACNKAKHLAAEIAQRNWLVIPRRIISDCTSEKVAMFLADQGGRIASMSAEGGVFDLMEGLYSKNNAPNFDVYLKGHAGDAIIVDRVSRESVQVERPALTCAYTIQPDVLRGLAKNRALRGRGLIARFLFSVPTSWIGYRDTLAPPVPQGVCAGYAAVVTRLAANKCSVTLELDHKARLVFQAWQSEIEIMLRDGGELDTIPDWGAKLAGATLRIAGVVHIAEHGCGGCIAEPTLRGAIEIARYLIPHAKAAIGLMGAQDPTNEAADWIVQWLLRNGSRQFSKSEVQQAGKNSRFPKADDVDAPLNMLEQRGYIRPLPVEASRPGRPASPVFAVNPGLFSESSQDCQDGISQREIASPESSQDFQDGSQGPKNQITLMSKGSQDIQDEIPGDEIADDEWETCDE